jgi:hypothetical protein
MCAKPFRQWIHKELDLRPEAVLYLCVNLVGSPLLPDFGVRHATTWQPACSSATTIRQTQQTARLKTQSATGRRMSAASELLAGAELVEAKKSAALLEMARRGSASTSGYRSTTPGQS